MQGSFGFNFGNLTKLPAKQSSLPPQRSSRRTPIEDIQHGANGSSQRHRSASVQRSSGTKRKTTPSAYALTPRLGKRKRGSPSAQANIGNDDLDELSPDRQENIPSIERSRKQVRASLPLPEEVKEDGLPIPKFESMLSNPDVVQALGGSTQVENKTSNVGNSTMDYEADIWKHINPESRKEYEKKLASLPPEEREVERMAVLGELKAQTGVSKKMEEAFVIERINRMKRKEAGQATLGDTIKSLWGWG